MCQRTKAEFALLQCFRTHNGLFASERASLAALFFIDCCVRLKKCRPANNSTSLSRPLTSNSASVLWHAVLFRQDYTDRPIARDLVRP
jgi:hypothetical protein